MFQNLNYLCPQHSKNYQCICSRLCNIFIPAGFFFFWEGRRGRRKAWGEESGLIFIPEISKLALELRKKSLGFPPLCDTAGIVDVPWGASSNINYHSFHLNPFYFLSILGMNAKENYLQKYFRVQKYIAVILQFLGPQFV